MNMQAKPSTDLIAAVLTHVSLMIAGIAFVYQVSDRLNSDLYDTVHLNKLYDHVVLENMTYAIPEFEMEKKGIEPPTREEENQKINDAFKVAALSVLGSRANFFYIYMDISETQKKFANAVTTVIDVLVCPILLVYFMLAIWCLFGLHNIFL